MITDELINREYLIRRNNSRRNGISRELYRLKRIVYAYDSSVNMNSFLPRTAYLSPATPLFLQLCLENSTVTKRLCTQRVRVSACVSNNQRAGSPG